MQRRKAVQDAAALLKELQRNLQYSRKPFYIALAESGIYDSFQIAIPQPLVMDTNETHEQYIERWLKAAGFKKNMTSKAYLLLSGALCEFGKSNGQIELQRLEGKRQQLLDEASLLYEQERRDVRLYRALGGYGGLAAALLLL